jgi:hypothetical protein
MAARSCEESEMLVSRASYCDHSVINTLLQGRPTLCQGVQDKRNTTEYWTVGKACTTIGTSIVAACSTLPSVF